MKSLQDLFLVLLAEAGRRCDTSTAKDANTVLSRVETEGLSFLTITLPRFAADFERSLELGAVGSNLFQGFSRKGGLPKFLWGFLRQVFDPMSGVLLDGADSLVVGEVRQICRFLSKYEGDCSPARVRAAISAFVECEQELSSLTIPPDILEDYVRLATLLFGDLFSFLDKSIYEGDHLPKHSSGSTADGLKGNQKYLQQEWPERSERSFPSWEMLVPSYRFNYRLESVKFLEPGAERPVKVITVPKTQKTPRIIAMEPTCMQYMQQGVLELFQEGMRSFPNSYHFVCFDSQIPNQELAQIGSRNGTLATLDLSEASDRVSYQLVKALLSRHRLLTETIDDCRSTSADVPGYGVITPLAKFASMGSALCFPIESLVFCTLVFVGIERSLGHRLTQTEVENLYGSVRIYGDDIIVPVDSVSSVIETLEASGLKVNTSKSFWTGLFRESCGKDYFGGDDVSVVKCRQDLPRSRKDVQQVVSAVSLRNQLSERGYWDTVVALDRAIGKLIPFPYVRSEASPVLGKIDPNLVVPGRMNQDLQRPEVRGVAVRATLPRNSLDEVDALMKFFLKRSEDPYEEGHLERSGRPVSAALVTRWAPLL